MGVDHLQGLGLALLRHSRVEALLAVVKIIIHHRQGVGKVVCLRIGIIHVEGKAARSAGPQLLHILAAEVLHIRRRLRHGDILSASFRPDLQIALSRHLHARSGHICAV